MSSFWNCRNPHTKKRRVGRTAPAARTFASTPTPDRSSIRQWTNTDETAKTIFDRLCERFWPTITPMPPLQRMVLHGRHVLEVTGASGSGKSELLLQSVVSCILPKEWRGLALGGSEKPVVYYDLDGRFDIRRLAHLLECRIYKAKWDAQAIGDGLNGLNIDFAAHQRLLDLTSLLINGLVGTCLSRFYLQRCHNTLEMLAAVKTTRYHFKQIGLIHGNFPELFLIDSITAFYWTERVTRMRYEDGGRYAILPEHIERERRDLNQKHCIPNAAFDKQTLNMQSVSGAVVNELRELLSVHPRLLIMATKTTILKNLKKADRNSGKGWQKRSFARMHRPGFRPITEELFELDGGCDIYSRAPAKSFTHADFLPAHWRGFVTHRILLKGPYMSESAPIVKFSRLSPAFFSAEWDKPLSRDVSFFTLQIDGIEEVKLVP